MKLPGKWAARILSTPYGYPPDMQLLATETVLKQAEMIADELTLSWIETLRLVFFMMTFAGAVLLAWT